MNRRSFLKSCGTLILGTTLAGLGGGVYSTLLEPEWLAVERISISLKHLSPALHGLRLAQLSDLHLGTCTDPSFIKTVINKAAELDPDLVVLTGDYVYEQADMVEQLGQLLEELSPPYGIWACLGNHDYWTDAAVVRSGLERAGVQVLVNENHRISVGEAGLILAGLDDTWSGVPDLEQALKGTLLDEPVVLLAHEPDPADYLLQDERVGLQLSGHSHGGQVRLPLIGAPVLPYLGSRYPAGLYNVHQGFLYVNRGVGMVPPGVRFNCRPEITEITLQSSEVLAQV
ncbi:MAG: metallophosphoesterase [Anaerolineales bacterium]|nr:metallophosphoesterase [Anaerolineales bacterium]